MIRYRVQFDIGSEHLPDVLVTAEVLPQKGDEFVFDDQGFVVVCVFHPVTRVADTSVRAVGGEIVVRVR